MLTRILPRVFIVPFLCLGLFSSLPAQQTPTPSELVSQANALSDLSLLGSYRLNAKINVGSGNNAAVGTLLLEHDQENSRQEIQFSDYHETSLILGNTGYSQRQPDKDIIALERIRHFEDLWRIAIPAGNEAAKVSTEKVNDIEALCFTAKFKKVTERHYCFDAATHLLLKRSGPIAGGSLEVLFLDYQTIGDVHFPKTIRFVESGHGPFEVNNIVVEKTSFAGAEFAPPAGAPAYATCRRMAEPMPLSPIIPEYPVLARLSHIQGTTIVRAAVGKDGKVRKVTPLSGHPILLESSINALKHTTYQPATCQSGPVDDEILVTINFYIR